MWTQRATGPLDNGMDLSHCLVVRHDTACLDDGEAALDSLDDFDFPGLLS